MEYGKKDILSQAAHEKATSWIRRRMDKIGTAATSLLYADPGYQALEKVADRAAQSGDVDATKAACHALMVWARDRTSPSTPHDRPGAHRGEKRVPEVV